MAYVGLVGVGRPVARLTIPNKRRGPGAGGNRARNGTFVEDIVEITKQARRRLSKVDRAVEAYRNTALRRRATAIRAKFGIR